MARGGARHGGLTVLETSLIEDETSSTAARAAASTEYDMRAEPRAIRTAHEATLSMMLRLCRSLRLPLAERPRLSPSAHAWRRRLTSRMLPGTDAGSV